MNPYRDDRREHLAGKLKTVIFGWQLKRKAVIFHHHVQDGILFPSPDFTR
jgi:hypothetical protein